MDIKSKSRILEILKKSLSIELNFFVWEPLSKRGSQREFFRLRMPDGSSFIVILYDPDRTENRYYADICDFLKNIGIKVPSIIFRLDEENILVLEDLGDMDLYSLRSISWEKRRIYYHKTIDEVSKLHNYPIETINERVKLQAPFDEGLYRWERAYFIENFVEKLVGLKLEEKFYKELEQEFERLTFNLFQTPKCLIHRDLQSQNVMVKGEDVYLIDFQGMRIGNPFYDLGSLVFDAYVSFSQSERQELIDAYLEISNFNLSKEEALYAITYASSQRLMQALGAFSYLSLVAGLSDFQRFIPQALENLSFLLDFLDYMKRLRELIEKCRETLIAKEVDFSKTVHLMARPARIRNGKKSMDGIKPKTE